MFLFLACTNTWVPGNEFFKATFCVRIHCSTRRKGRRQLYCNRHEYTFGVAVLHSSLKHVRSHNLHTTHSTRSGPSKGHRVRKYYAYCKSVKFLLIYVVFQNVKIIYCATSASSFEKNNYHKLHTLSRSAIIEKAAPMRILIKSIKLTFTI